MGISSILSKPYAREIKQITASGAFDADWYLAKYPDVPVKTLKGAIRDFASKEPSAGRFPNPYFDSVWYFNRNPEVRESGQNPLLHYMNVGAQKGLDPNPWIDSQWYGKQRKVNMPNFNALLDYTKIGTQQKLDPGPRFSVQEYADENPEVAAENALAHFMHRQESVTHGWLGTCTSSYVTGWACRLSGPRPCLKIYVNNILVGSIVPWLSRPDVEATGMKIVSGFFFSFPSRLSTGDVVDIQDENSLPLLGSPSIYNVPVLELGSGLYADRNAIASKFLKGSGLEIGAFTQPTDLPPDFHIEYYDKFPPVEIRKMYDENWGRPLVEPHYHGDAQLLEGIGDKTFDFIVANHVIEHLEDPITFIKSVLYRLNPDGHAMIAAPNKRFSFDSDRQLTTFQHLLDDYNHGSSRSRKTHYFDWACNVDKLQGEDAKNRAQHLDESDFSIHYHVWDENSFVNFITSVIQFLDLPMSLVLNYSANAEIIVILQKRDNVAGL
jgi:SAM-dependent methyltransferase